MTRVEIESKLNGIIDDVIEEKAARFQSKIMMKAAMLEYRIQKQSFRNNN
jgi:hypothetical protein